MFLVLFISLVVCQPLFKTTPNWDDRCEKLYSGMTNTGNYRKYWNLEAPCDTEKDRFTDLSRIFNFVLDAAREKRLTDFWHVSEAFNDEEWCEEAFLRYMKVYLNKAMICQNYGSVNDIFALIHPFLMDDVCWPSVLDLGFKESLPGLLAPCCSHSGLDVTKAVIQLNQCRLNEILLLRFYTFLDYDLKYDCLCSLAKMGSLGSVFKDLPTFYKQVEISNEKKLQLIKIAVDTGYQREITFLLLLRQFFELMKESLPETLNTVYGLHNCSWLEFIEHLLLVSVDQSYICELISRMVFVGNLDDADLALDVVGLYKRYNRNRYFQQQAVKIMELPSFNCHKVQKKLFRMELEKPKFIAINSHLIGNYSMIMRLEEYLPPSFESVKKLLTHASESVKWLVFSPKWQNHIRDVLCNRGILSISLNFSSKFLFDGKSVSNEIIWSLGTALPGFIQTFDVMHFDLMKGRSGDFIYYLFQLERFDELIDNDEHVCIEFINSKKNYTAFYMELYKNHALTSDAVRLALAIKAPNIETLFDLLRISLNHTSVHSAFCTLMILSKNHPNVLETLQFRQVLSDSLVLFKDHQGYIQCTLDSIPVAPSFIFNIQPLRNHFELFDEIFNNYPIASVAYGSPGNLIAHFIIQMVSTPSITIYHRYFPYLAIMKVMRLLSVIYDSEK